MEQTYGATDEMEQENARALAGKYLAFKLSDQLYCVDILKVQEIIRWLNVTRVPKTPEFLLGVVNLRGRIVPVMDLRLKLGMSSTEITERTCIVIFSITSGTTETTMGAVVDDVAEVFDLEPEQIDTSTWLRTEDMDADFIVGVGKVEGDMAILLSVDKVLTGGVLSLENALEVLDAEKSEA